MSENLFFPDWDSTGGGGGESVHFFAAETQDMDRQDEVSRLAKAAKTEEEIEKYAVPEDMEEWERLAWLLQHGVTMQKQYAIHNIATILTREAWKKQTPLSLLERRTIGPSSLSSVYTEGSLPQLNVQESEESTTNLQPPEAKTMNILLNMLTKETVEMKTLAAKVLHGILDEDVLDSEIATSVLKASVKLMEASESELKTLWSDVVLSAIKRASVKYLEKEILPEAFINGGLAQPPRFRQWCCKTLGALAFRLPRERIEGQFFKKAISLCQDTDHEVRCTMCNELNYIAQHVSGDLVRTDVIQEYVELLGDEDVRVREAAVGNFISLLKLLDEDSLRNEAIPMLRKIAGDANQKVISIMLAQFGELYVAIKDAMTEDDQDFFIAVYSHNALSCSTPWRISCVHNLPAVVLCLGKDKYHKIRSVVDSFSKDADVEVRRKLACGLYEIAKILGDTSFSELNDLFHTLIQDSTSSVNAAMLENVDGMLKLFVENQEIVMMPSFERTFIILCNKERECAESRTMNWRAHHRVLRQFHNFVNYFDNRLVFDIAVPMLQEHLLENYPMMPTKRTVMSTLCNYMRYLKSAELRERVLIRAKEELARADSYRHRLLFLIYCSYVVVSFSVKYFKQNLLTDVIDLLDDPIANVRCRAYLLLPQLKQYLKIPRDLDIIRKLEDIISRQSPVEKDSDVLNAMKAFAKTKADSISEDFSHDPDRQKEEEEDFIQQKEVQADLHKREQEMEDARYELNLRLHNKTGVKLTNRKFAKLEPRLKAATSTVLTSPAASAKKPAIAATIAKRSLSASTQSIPVKTEARKPSDLEASSKIGKGSLTSLDKLETKKPSASVDALKKLGLADAGKKKSTMSLDRPRIDSKSLRT